MNVVEVRGACKVFGKSEDSQIVLNELDMTVNSGSIYGLLGASACGKTTLLCCILGMTELDKGEIKVLGHISKQTEVLKVGARVGYMPQETALLDDLTIKETIYYFGRIHLMTSEQLKESFIKLMELLELPNGDQMVSECSGGEKRRISFAAAMVHEPDLLILDEPTVGVDSILRAKIWNFMINITRSSRVAIIITTHYIEEAKQADRVGLMRDGTLLAEDSPINIVSRFETDSLEEAFLKLCMSQENGECSSENSKRNNESNPTAEMKESSHECDLKEESRRTFHWIIIKALITKYLIQMKRQPLFLLIILIFPLIETVFFYLAIGGIPTGIRFGIVNEEVSSYLDCFNESLVTATIIGRDCELNKVSCRFLKQFSEDVAIKVYYDSFDEAYSDAKRGKIMGLIHFGPNFTESVANTVADYIPTKEKFAGGSINIHMDETDLQLKLFVTQSIFEAFKDYTESLMSACNLPKKLKNLPIEYMQPIYGNLKSNFTHFMAPAMMIVIVYYISVSLSALCLICDRKEGFWNRTLLAGVTTSEILASYIAINSISLIIQIAVIFATAGFIFNAEARGSVLLMYIMVLMLGYSGMACGLLLSAVCSSLLEILVVLIGMSNPMIYISGIFWPLEGMPTALRFIAYLMPFTLPTYSVLDIMVKGNSYNSQSFVLGIVASVVWILVCSALGMKVLKKKKYSKNS